MKSSIDLEKQKLANRIHRAYLDHGPTLTMRDVERFTGLNEFQCRAGVKILLNNQILTEAGIKGDIFDPFASFTLTWIGKIKQDEMAQA